LASPPPPLSDDIISERPLIEGFVSNIPFTTL
jgi:hypothetical protein